MAASETSQNGMARKQPPQLPSRPLTTSGYPSEYGRRPIDPRTPVAKQDPAAASANARDRCMVVGRDVHLTGKVSACDQLTVDGIVEITLTDARLLRIGQSGHFKGHVDVAEAEIAGHFEGDLTVREKLTVLATAHITGIIRYGHIVVEAGGHLAGEISGLNEDKTDAAGGDQTRGVDQKPVVNVDPRPAAAGRPAIPPRQQIPGQQAPLVPKP